VLLVTGRTYDDRADAASGWALTETVALAVLVALTVRVAPPRRAAVAAVAVPAWLLRFGTPSLVMLAAYAAWGLLVALAAMVGLYLRSLDRHRRHSVTEARREQRLRLAGDLHDFVAHDVSEMLAQAQAGQILADQDPARAAEAFHAIEQAGQRALASLDRTVRMLHDHSDQRTPTPADLPELTARFAASSSLDVTLDVDPALDLPHETATTAYRVVVEALTNIRRHAPTARHVEVTVHHTPGAVRVTVTDDGQSAGPPDATDGKGSTADTTPPTHPDPSTPDATATTDDGQRLPSPLGATATRPGLPSDHASARTAAAGPSRSRHHSALGAVGAARGGREGGGLGLDGLRGRVRELGGTLEAGPRSSGGWRVAAVLPVAGR
jgi:signal transduction histidine kinase